MAMTVSNSSVVTENVTAAESAAAIVAAQKESEETEETEEKTAGVVYSKSDDTDSNSSSKIYDRSSIVNQLKADEAQRKANLINLVQETINKQSNTYNISRLFTDVTGSADRVAQAQAAIADDGYWGVEQTSDRIVNMAIALSGGDVSKADELTAAIEKGFAQATKALGDDLPQISKDTMSATLQKMEDWKNSVE